jgi:hypothetical protein
MTRRSRVTLIIVGGVIAMIAMLAVAAQRFDVPFTGIKEEWAIGIGVGETPFDLVDPPAGNPVLRTDGGGDIPDHGYADPFLFAGDDAWLMFYEIIQRDDDGAFGEHGVIGLARSDDGIVWESDGVVLEEPFHLSYPQVFEVDGSHFMVPESNQAGEVILYRATDFPSGWTREATILDGVFADPTIFEFEGRWWLFVTDSSERADDTLRLFHADALLGPWAEHPSSPVVDGDVSKARSAGGVIEHDGELFRFAQDNTDGYGKAVVAIRIDELTTSRYAETPRADNPVVEASGSGWNSSGMHHVSAVRMDDGTYLAAVDGYRTFRVFGPGS